MVYIYVLKLENNKYYVGKTSNPSFRMESHFNENGSAWTRKYKPIKLEALIPDCDDYDEDKYTKIYMDKYGIDNVRGGSFVSIKLDKNIIDCLKLMNSGTNNKCFTCGKEGHFAKECNVSKENDISQEYYHSIDINIICKCVVSHFLEHRRSKCLLLNNINKFKKIFVNDLSSTTYIDKNNNCIRCGRKGHNISSCYARKHIKGFCIK